VLFQKRYYNALYKKIYNHLKDVNPTSSQAKLVLALIKDPTSTAVQQLRASQATLADKFDNVLPHATADQAAGWSDSLSATQFGVLEQVMTCKTPLSLIWGPPGTGKTHWLASFILHLLLDAATSGTDGTHKKDIKILVSAQNHNAIENLIRAVAKLTQQHPQKALLCDKTQVGIGKITGGTTGPSNDPPPFESLGGSKGSVNKFLNGKHASVLGATVWAVNKLDPACKFDVVIVDEASQLLVGEATMALMKVTAERGSRIILAGDHKQLPPILKRTYTFQEERVQPPPPTPQKHTQTISGGSGGAGGGGTTTGITASAPPSEVASSSGFGGSAFPTADRRLGDGGGAAAAPSQPAAAGSKSPRVWSSIFQCVMEQASELPKIMGVLSENRRMSTALCRYPVVAGMYERTYCAHPSIATQQFVLQRKPGDDSMTTVSLDAAVAANEHRSIEPDILTDMLPQARLREIAVAAFEWTGSTVIIQLKGQPGPAWVQAEARLVAHLATYLRLHFVDPHAAVGGGGGGGAAAAAGLVPFAHIEDAEDDAAFWANRLAVITPHHVQRIAIQTQIKQMWDRSPESPPPRVATVEKIQGQEADVVISCYGMNDAEQLVRVLGFWVWGGGGGIWEGHLGWWCAGLGAT
jgi:hypothetical protein